MSFMWPSSEATRSSPPDQAQVICKAGHVRWVDWDDRHAGRNLTDPHYGFVCCNICPRGQDHTSYTGKFRYKETV